MESIDDYIKKKQERASKLKFSLKVCTQVVPISKILQTVSYFLQNQNDWKSLSHIRCQAKGSANITNSRLLDE